MQPRGWVVLVVLFAIVGVLALSTAYVGNLVRGDYRVASREDMERTSVDLTDARVVWVEQVHATPVRGAVVSYDIATAKRTTLDPGSASMAFPVVVDGDLAAWVVGDGPFAVRVHDYATGRDVTIGGPGDNLTLPGRTLEDRRLVVAGTRGGSAPSAFVVDVSAADEVTIAPLKVASGARILDGSVLTWDPDAPSSPLALSDGRVWWWRNATIAGAALDGPSPRPFEAGGPVLGLDADHATLAWDEDHGRVRRVLFTNLDGGTQGEVSTFPADQHGAAVNGTRVAFVQHDGLVRLKDVAIGDERVLPARTQENLGIRLAPHWASWLSGTIEGHNVMLVPLR